MKITKSQLEAMIMESVKQQAGHLNEQELEELLGGLRNMFGAGAKAVGGAVRGAGQAVAGAAQKAGQAVVGQAQKAGQAVGGAVNKAGAAVKGAYQQGETAAAVQSVSKGIQAVIQTIDKSIQTVGKTDPNMVHNFDNVKNALQGAERALTEGTKSPQKKRHEK